MLRRALRYLLGWDVFISYSRADGGEYAERLYDLLPQRISGISIYADWVHAPIGKTLPWPIRWALRRSHRLLVILTPNATQSDYVREEVATFAKVRHPVVIPIIVSGVERPPWPGLEGAKWLNEPVEAFAENRAQPSQHVFARIDEVIHGNTQRRRTKRAAVASVGGVIASLTVSGLLVQDAIRKRDTAMAETTKQQKLAREAESRRAAAVQQQEQAKRARGAALTAKQQADAEARRQSEIAEATSLGTQAAALLHDRRNLVRATMLAAAAMRRLDELGIRSATTDFALRDAILSTGLIHRRIAFSQRMGIRTVSRDGRYAAALDGRYVELIDLDAGSRRTLELTRDSNAEATDLIFSDDGTHLIAAATFKRRSWLRVWRTVAGQPAGPLASFELPLNGITIAGDGCCYATWMADKVRVWSTATNEPRSAELHHEFQLDEFVGQGARLGFSASLRYLAVDGSDSRVWDLHNGDTDALVELPGASDFRFTPDEDAVFVAGPRGVSAYEFATKKLRSLTEPKTSIDLNLKYELSGFDTDGDFVAKIRGDSVHVIEIKSGDLRAILYMPRPQRVVIRDDRVGVLCGDGTARLYDWHEDRELAHVPHPHDGAAIALRASGKVVSVSWDEALIWTPDEHRGVAWTAGAPYHAAFAPESGLVAMTTDANRSEPQIVITIYDSRNGGVIDARAIEDEGVPMALAYGRNGVIAVGTQEGNVFVSDARGELRKLQIPLVVRTLVFSPSSRYLAATGGPRLFIWDLQRHDDKFVAVDSSAEIISVAFASDEEVVTSSTDERLRWHRWQRATHRAVTAPPSPIAATPEGHIVSASGDEVLLRDGNGRILERIHHGAGVTHVDTAADGIIVSGGEDGMIRVWRRNPDLPPTEISRIRASPTRIHPYVFAVSPDGRYLVRHDPERVHAELLAPRDLVAFACRRLAASGDSRDPYYSMACGRRVNRLR